MYVLDEHIGMTNLKFV